jgi:hypothetical protein
MSIASPAVGTNAASNWHVPLAAPKATLSNFPWTWKAASRICPFHDQTIVIANVGLRPKPTVAATV